MKDRKIRRDVSAHPSNGADPPSRAMVLTRLPVAAAFDVAEWQRDLHVPG
jgi:hypothetical protein